MLQINQEYLRVNLHDQIKNKSIDIVKSDTYNLVIR